MSKLFIAYLYLQARLTRLNVQATSANSFVSIGSSKNFSFSLAFFDIIISFIAITLVCRMLYCLFTTRTLFCLSYYKRF